MLDEPSAKRRVQPSDKVLEEVKEMYGDSLKSKMMYLYNDFGQGNIVYMPSERQTQAIKGVLKMMHGYLESLLKIIPKCKEQDLIDSQKLLKSVLPMAHPADHMFLKSLISTQLLVTYLEEHS